MWTVKQQHTEGHYRQWDKTTRFIALKRIKNLKKLREDKSDVYVNDVFVSEDLTSKQAGMPKRARLLKKVKRISDTWARDEVIFIKLKECTIDSFIRKNKQLHCEDKLPERVIVYKQ